MNTSDINNQLEVIERTINKGEWLSEALDRQGDKFIPTNIFLNKVEPGQGATHGELKSERHSIIIEPPVPAIESKITQNSDWLGVYEKVTQKQVEKYLKRKDIKWKKIITTPEGYMKKVLPAAKKVGVNLHEDFFCLYDECEKITQDSDFRDAISLPIKDFLKYKEKAFVSATPLQPRNPIFKKLRFKWMIVTPTYDYRKDATLLVTRRFENSVIEEITRLLETGLPISVFYKSTQGINKIIAELLERGLIGENDYKVFCSEKSVKELKKVYFKNSHSSIDYPLAKINFFTSRFFSAFDLLAKEHHHILVLSNYREADHSLIDPYTEAVQIQGRFRKKFKDGMRYRSLTYITNINPNLTVRSDEEVTSDIRAMKDAYYSIKELRDNSINDAEVKRHNKQLKKMDYCRFLDADGEPDYFKEDNPYNEERVKAYYLSAQSLRQAYEATGHFNITLREDNRFSVEDLKLQAKYTSETDKMKFIIESLERINDNQDEMKLLYNAFGDDYWLIEAYQDLGKEAIENAKYNRKKITALVQEVKRKQDAVLRFSKKVLNEIWEEFKEEVLSQSHIAKEDFIKRLGDVFKTNGITYKVYGDGKNSSEVMCSITNKTVKDYFDVSIHNAGKAPSYKLKAFKSELVRN